MHNAHAMRWLVVLVLLGVARPAAAHDVRGDVIFLDIGERAVDVELDVPLPQLALARHESVDALLAEPRESLTSDVRRYVSLRGRDGTAFALAIGGITRREIAGGPVMSFALRFTPPPGETARWFRIADELVLHTVANTNIYVFVRCDLDGDALCATPTLVGAMHYQARELVVDRTSGSWRTGLGAAFHLGLDHIREGTDHLMFLLALLVVAPLVAAGGAWTGAASARRGLIRTAAIATAFTLGHSITLAIGAIGGVALPARFVESAIAVSILVSAIHAWRPLFAGREPLVAAAFGLVHGLAFATALAAFGFDRTSLVLALLGFNCGVEAMQLVVIAITVPSLMVLARFPIYAHLRRAAAALAGLAALAWLAERALGVHTPITAVVERGAAHGTWIAIGLAGMALAGLFASHASKGNYRHETQRMLGRRTGGVQPLE